MSPNEKTPEILTKLKEEHGYPERVDSNFLILKNFEDRLLRAFTPEGKLITEWPYKSFTTQFLIQDELLITFSGESSSFGEVRTFDRSGDEVHHFEAMERDEEVLKVTNHLRIKKDDVWGDVNRSFEPLTDVLLWKGIGYFEIFRPRSDPRLFRGSKRSD